MEFSKEILILSRNYSQSRGFLVPLDHNVRIFNIVVTLLVRYRVLVRCTKEFSIKIYQLVVYIIYT